MWGQRPGHRGAREICVDQMSALVCRCLHQKQRRRHILLRIILTSKWQFLIGADFGKILGVASIHSVLRSVGFLRRIQAAPPHQLGGLGERCELLQWGLGRSGRN